MRTSSLPELDFLEIVQWLYYLRHPRPVYKRLCSRREINHCKSNAQARMKLFGSQDPVEGQGDGSLRQPFVIDIEANNNSELKVQDVVPKRAKMWWHYPFLVKLNILLLAGTFANIVSGYDGSMMNGLQSLPSWQNYFDKRSGQRLGTMSNGLTIGNLITVPFVWYLIETLGRRPTLIIGASIIILGGILQGVAQNFSMFVAARIVLGVGGCLTSSVAPIYL
jgi:hypothetical protein